MTRYIILLIVFFVSPQVQALSGTDIQGEWEWIGDSMGLTPNPDAAIKTNETHIILFKDKSNPKIRYIENNNQNCARCDGNYALVSTQDNKPFYKYVGTWSLNNDVMVINRKAIEDSIGNALKYNAQRITYYKEKNIFAFGSLVNNLKKGKFSYYKKRPSSSVSLSPYYSKIKDKFVNDLDISTIKLGMTPKSVINNIKKEFIINDVIQFDKYDILNPYVEKITATRKNLSKIDNYIFIFSKPPYANRLLSIHSNQRFVVKGNMQNNPPSMVRVKTSLLKKYGKAKIITNEKKDMKGKNNSIVISWFNKPESCTTQFKFNVKKPECPILFDAKLSSFSMRHSKYPGLTNLLELHLVNYPEIVQNGRAAYQQDKAQVQQKTKPLQQKDTLEFEL